MEPVCVAVFAIPPFVDEHVAVNFVIGAPLFAPAAYVTVSEPVAVFAVAGVALAPVGAAGVPIVTACEYGDGALVPNALIAETANVYATPFVNPVTTWVVAVELKVCVVFGWPGARNDVTT